MKLLYFTAISPVVLYNFIFFTKQDLTYVCVYLTFYIISFSIFTKQDLVLHESPGLETLNLSFNKLRSLPEDFFSSTPNITELVLRNNLLISIPARLLEVIY